MYIPAHFRQDDLAQLHAQMRQAPLATLVSEQDIPRLRVIKRQYNVLTN